MKRIVRKIAFGIAVGCVGFVAMLFLSALIVGDAETALRRFTGAEHLKTALCYMIIALGFSLPSLVYEREQLAIGVKIGVHMGIGTLVYLLTAFAAGWVTTGHGAGPMVGYVLLAVVIAAAWWLLFRLYFYWEAHRINAKIREIEGHPKR